MISKVYFEAAKRFGSIEIVACTDMVPDAAKVSAATYGVRVSEDLDAMLVDPDVDAVVNLTPPKAHYLVNAAALSAGKHVYTEKPLATTYVHGMETLALANQRGLVVGSAPDTFLGAGLQTCREVIDSGRIGEPVAAAAFLASRGPDNWHPNPAFFYDRGAGPLFDVGPYYLTALVALLGPMRRVCAMARTSFSERSVTTGPNAGIVIRPEVPTHVTGSVEMAAGALATVITSFDIAASELPRIEIYGSEGTLSVPDPNKFGGPVRVCSRGGQWEEIPLDRPYTEQSRGLGIAEMATAVANGRSPRASGQMALHVLEAMEALVSSAEDGAVVTLGTTCDRPEALPADLREGEI
jgi:predicted dehydrogenase